MDIRYIASGRPVHYPKVDVCENAKVREIQSTCSKFERIPVKWME